MNRDLVLTAIGRGLSKRCPHCGRGPLFERWSRHLERCPVCGLVYERNPGDTWAFTIIGDRLPIAAIVVLIYFGYGRSHHVLGVLTFIALGVLLVWTAPNRWGAGIGLHYLSRVIWPDPEDPVPPAHPSWRTATETPRHRAHTAPRGRPGRPTRPLTTSDANTSPSIRPGLCSRRLS